MSCPINLYLVKQIRITLIEIVTLLLKSVMLKRTTKLKNYNQVLKKDRGAEQATLRVKVTLC
jgi:hypothetical protein